MNKKMKKAAAVIASAVLCLSMSMSVFAAESVTDPDINKPVYDENRVIDYGFGETKDGQTVSVFGQKVSEEVEKVLNDEEAVKDILTDAGYKVPENSEVVVLGSGDLKITNGVDVSDGADFEFNLGWIYEHSDERPDTYTNNIDNLRDLQDGDTIYLLHQKADGTWEVIEGTVSVKVYHVSDTSVQYVYNVTANMTGFSPVAFIKVMSDGKVVVMDKDENIVKEVETSNGVENVKTAAPATKTSPKTGE